MADQDKIKGYMENDYLPTMRATKVEDQITGRAAGDVRRHGRASQNRRSPDT